LLARQGDEQAKRSSTNKETDMSKLPDKNKAPGLDYVLPGVGVRLGDATWDQVRKSRDYLKKQEAKLKRNIEMLDLGEKYIKNGLWK